MCQRLAKLAPEAVRLLDADRMGHSTYAEPDSDCFRALVAEFGSGIVDQSTGLIDRRRLGALVFGSTPEAEARLRRLGEIVWPFIRLAVEAQLKAWTLTPEERASGRLVAGKPRVVLMDAAVLMEAGWDTACNEVWVCSIPRKEAVARLIARNRLSEEDASKRVAAQLSNHERFKCAPLKPAFFFLSFLRYGTRNLLYIMYHRVLYILYTLYIGMRTFFSARFGSRR